MGGETERGELRGAVSARHHSETNAQAHNKTKHPKHAR